MITGKRKAPLTRDEAETIALQALGFLAEDETRLVRFLSITGVLPEQLRSAAASPTTLTAVLDYLLGDESLLLVFAAGTGLAPESIAPAREAIAQEHGERRAGTR